MIYSQHMRYLIGPRGFRGRILGHVITPGTGRLDVRYLVALDSGPWAGEVWRVRHFQIHKQY
jgi:hypothetical protein